MDLPPLFPSMIAFLLSAVIVAGAQVIYATVGFGAGMFSVALLALLLPDLRGAVAALWLLTLVTEVWVLAHAWHHARVRFLLGLLPTTVIGLWIGTEILSSADVSGLKRALGGVVLAAGTWFLYRDATTQEDTGDARHVRREGVRVWLSAPAGLVSGLLAGLFGTGGPPVIVLLKSYRLDKSAFRATILWFFLLMSVVRGVTYLRAEVLAGDELRAALWLLPGSLAGAVLGSMVHHRLSEGIFARVVSVLLMILGALLLLTGGR